MSAPVRPGAEARALLDERLALAGAAATVLAAEEDLRRRIVRIVDGYRDARLREELAGIEVGRLRETTERNLRLQALEDAAVRTVRDVHDAGAERLEALPGVGPHTARAVAAAAGRLADTLRAGLPVRLDMRGDGPLGLGLAALLHRLHRLDELLAPHRDELTDFTSSVDVLARRAQPARSRLGLLLRRSRTRDRARKALDGLAGWGPWLASTDLPDVVARLTAHLAEEPPGPLTVWEDVERDAATYYALLGEVVPGINVLGHGALPAELARRIETFPLDTSLLRARLRGYQAFGARFALNQGRTLIGDEMGLGKTVQAIAVMAHLAATGERDAVVVCPASVVVNWCREVAHHSELPVHRIHGPGREDALAAWHRDGGIAVTTFEALRHLPLPPTPTSPTADLLREGSPTPTLLPPTADLLLERSPTPTLLPPTADLLLEGSPAPPISRRQHSSFRRGHRRCLSSTRRST